MAPEPSRGNGSVEKITSTGTATTVLAALPGAVITRDGLANNLAFLQMDLTDPELRPHAPCAG